MSHLKWFRDFLSKSKISKFWWFFRDRNNICNGSIRSTPTWKSIFRGSDMQISILPGSPKSVSVTHYPLSDHHDSVMGRKIFFLVPTINPWTGSVQIFRARKVVTRTFSSAPEAQCCVTHNTQQRDTPKMYYVRERSFFGKATEVAKICHGMMDAHEPFEILSRWTRGAFSAKNSWELPECQNEV